MLDELNKNIQSVAFKKIHETKFKHSYVQLQKYIVVRSDVIDKLRLCDFFERMINMYRNSNAGNSRRIKSSLSAFTSIK